MGVILRRHHRHLITTLIVFALLSSSSSAYSLNRLSGGLGETAKETGLAGRIVDQKRLGGVGSAPPRCRWKCGKCGPCKAVHVPIKPGQIAELEYYPEAWRCKCGNKIFMP